MPRLKTYICLSLLVCSLSSRADDVLDYEDVRAFALPIMEITTVDGEEPTCEYVSAPEGEDGQSIINATKVPGRVTISIDGNVCFDSGEYKKDASGMTVKIRGNTSAYNDKKPFKLKLQKKADLLLRDDDRYKDKDWVLIDDGVDRNNSLVGYKMGELLGMPWTPTNMYVNLFFNGDYRGVYMLVESVKRNADARIDVDENSGYIIERDAYWWNEDVYFESDKGKKYTFKYPDPDDITTTQIEYIKGAVNEMESAIDNGNYSEVLDVRSFATWMMALDILGEFDSAGANIYLTKYDDTADTPFQMGPLWDFDNCFRTPDSWARIHTNASVFYYTQLFVSNEFVNTYCNLWEEIGAKAIGNMLDYLNEFKESDVFAALDKSTPYEAQRWNYPADSSEYVVDNIIEWFTTRKTWMANAVKTLQSETGIINTVAPTMQPYESVYNLGGQKVTEDFRGIQIRDGKKVIRRN